MMTRETRDELALQGASVWRDFLDPDEVAGLRGAEESLRAGGVPMSRQVLYTHEDPPPDAPTLSDLMEQWLNPRGLEIAPRRLVARLEHTFSELHLVPFQDVLLVKQPWHREFAWHQDEAFWPFDAPEGVVVWCPLDDVDRERGGLEVALASHLEGRLAAIDLHTGRFQRGGAPPEMDRFTHLCPTLRAGDALLFTARTWHRSGVNRGPAARRAWSSSWISRDAVVRPDLAPRHPLATARGPA